MPFYRFSRWDGTQQVPPIDGEGLMEQLSDHLVAHGDIASALRSLAQRGIRTRSGRRISGIQDMLQRLGDARQGILDRYSLDHVLDDITARLADIVQAERQGIQRRLSEAGDRMDAKSEDPSSGDPSSPTPEQRERLLGRLEEMARRNLELLDSLPPELARAIQQLKDFDFMYDGARASFDELLKSLQERALEAYLRDLSQRLGPLGSMGSTGSGSSEDREALKAMLRDLNRLLEEHINDPGEGAGGAAGTLMDRFMEQYGSLFGSEAHADVEGLVRDLQRRMAQMESLMNSLSPELRRQLQETLDSILQDPALSERLEQLAWNLERFGQGSPRLELPFKGDEALGLEEALEAVEHLQKLESLESQLKGAQCGNPLDNVDGDLMRELLGAGSWQELQDLAGIAEALEGAGYIRWTGNQFELTPRGIRKIGSGALQEIFAFMRKDQAGSHPTASSGAVGEVQEDTRKYQFGDPLHLHLHRTLMNAVQRSPGTPVRIKPEDFEVRGMEHASQAATVLMVDLSLSMVMRGNFMAAKKVALALDNLIRTRFPKDTLYILGFSTYARELKPDKLPYLSWDEFDPYTNIQHGLMVARKLLAQSPGTTRQIIMISDGEPTAHVEGGELHLQYPPSPRTITETLKEVKRCTRQDIRINTFMLERSPNLLDFVGKMTRINRGRVFYTSPAKLGEYILVDYLSNRRTLVS